jgi:dTDP-4-amino-4,6-dideoxygalactose transaminase
MVDMPRLMEIARERNWQVVEDACQCPGATIANRAAGSWGDASVLSFGGSKLLTAGRGGAVLTDDPAIHQRLKIYGDRGNQAFPLSELQAAVLIPQLERLEERNGVRRQRVRMIQEALQEVRDVLRPVTTRPTDQPAYYKVAWSLVAAEERPELREAFLAKLQAMRVPIDAGFRGFADRSDRRCTKLGPLDASRRLSRSTVLLHHPILLAQEKSALQATELLSRVARQLVA